MAITQNRLLYAMQDLKIDEGCISASPLEFDVLEMGEFDTKWETMDRSSFEECPNASKLLTYQRFFKSL